MAVTIPNSTTYQGGFLSSHTITAFDGSGTDSTTVLGSFNKNPATEVTAVTADGNNMSLIDTNANANVCSIQAYNYVINDSSFNIVVSTPSFKEEAAIAINLNGVNQTTPYNSTVVKAGTFSSNAYATITGTAGSMLIVFCVSQNDRTMTASNCTQIQNFSPTSSIGTVFAGYVEATGSSQANVGVTLSSADNWRCTIVEFYAAGGTSVTYAGYYGIGGWF